MRFSTVVLSYLLGAASAQQPSSSTSSQVLHPGGTVVVLGPSGRYTTTIPPSEGYTPPPSGGSSSTEPRTQLGEPTQRTVDGGVTVSQNNTVLNHNYNANPFQSHALVRHSNRWNPSLRPQSQVSISMTSRVRFSAVSLRLKTGPLLHGSLHYQKLPKASYKYQPSRDPIHSSAFPPIRQQTEPLPLRLEPLRLHRAALRLAQPCQQ